MKGRYPLDALQRIRRGAVDDRVRELGEQAKNTESARARQTLAEQRRARAEQEAREEEERERVRLEAGEGRARDLQAEAAWQAAEKQRIAALRRRELDAKDAAMRAERAQVEARARLAMAEAEARAVEKHREHWQGERAREREIAEEDAAQEGLSARRREGEH